MSRFRFRFPTQFLLVFLWGISVSASANDTQGSNTTTRAPGFASPRIIPVQKQPQDTAYLDVNSLIPAARIPNQFTGAQGARAYTQVFSGTGTGEDERDASINGDGYLTFTVLSNRTYDVDACLSYCDSIEPCIFVNLYYELNNIMYDSTGQASNLKCVAYNGIHNATEKTNFGGQTLITGMGETYIQQSTGWALATSPPPPPPPPPAPTTPSGYDFIFGPVTALTSSPQSLNSTTLETYDVQACADLCTRQPADPVFGLCKFFNVYRISVSVEAEGGGGPGTYSCNLFGLATGKEHLITPDEDSGISVSDSRGYARTNLLIDGGFESYTDCSWFCISEHTSGWDGISSNSSNSTFTFSSNSSTTTAGTPGKLDATIVYYDTYAYSGHVVGILGSITNSDSLPGTLQARNPLVTVNGRVYVISFFVDASFSGPGDGGEGEAWHEVLWNGGVVRTWMGAGDGEGEGYHGWRYYEVTVVGTGTGGVGGGDVLALRGGKAPAWSFVDEVYVFEA